MSSGFHSAHACREFIVVVAVFPNARRCEAAVHLWFGSCVAGVYRSRREDA